MTARMFLIASLDAIRSRTIAILENFPALSRMQIRQSNGYDLEYLVFDAST